MRSKAVAVWLTTALAAAAASLPPAAAGPTPVDPGAALAGLERRYRSVTSVSARFVQVYRAPGVETVESGSCYLKKPGLMRWEYREPEAKLFVADGKNTYLHTPADRQVIVARFGAGDLRSTPLEFLLGQGSAGRSFVAAEELELRPRLPGTALVRLYPRSSGAEYEYVAIEFDETTFDLRRLVIREVTGGTSEFVFTDLRLDEAMEPNRFRFKIPKGVEVIRVEEP